MLPVDITPFLAVLAAVSFFTVLMKRRTSLSYMRPPSRLSMLGLSEHATATRQLTAPNPNFAEVVKMMHRNLEAELEGNTYEVQAAARLLDEYKRLEVKGLVSEEQFKTLHTKYRRVVKSLKGLNGV